MRAIRIPSVLLTVFALFVHAASAQSGFYLKSGDRVVFYGDSITDQRLYTTFVETFVRTRFPGLNVSFVHSGWGGDRVTGGGGGPIDLRLRRDVAAYKPTVVTIMLGMNDGRYRPFDQGVFDWYKTGYELMLKDLKSVAPEARITLIRPSPYDEVTRPAISGGGYNTVMVKFGDLLQQMASQQGMQVADLNGPVVRMLEEAKSSNAEVAARIIPDRVHPGPAGHLIMAAALLESWGAPGLVSNVEIDARVGKVVSSDNTTVSGLTAADGLSWTQTDRSLPMPVNLDDATMALAVKSGGFLEKMDRETLKVGGLQTGYYALRIDGSQVAVFTAEQLGTGLNLTGWPTPMMKQANEVHSLTLKRSGIHNTRWRTIQVPLADDHLAGAQAAMDALDTLDTELDAKQRAAAAPLARHYELVPVTADESHVPPGFTPIFNGKDTTGWHVSRTNHHGTSPDWHVENGVLVGMQQPVGKGGIILTDKKYKNFEVYLELNPDWGCDGGLFLRSSEQGEAYQVMIDYREGGTLGGVYGERLKDVSGSSVVDWEKYYRRGEWNAIRARVTGDIPHIQVWMNGTRVTDWPDVTNHAAGGALDGMIAVQVHGGTEIWKAGGKQRFRNIAIKELP